MKLIFNGDDFGYSRGVNWGIIDAYMNGILTSATVMTNMPGAGHAFELALAHPDLGVGVHLNITTGNPILSTHSTLIQEDGTLRPRSFYKNGGTVNTEEIYSEWKAQIECAVDGGIIPTHLDSHHHIHSYEGITDVFVSLAREYQLPTRVLSPYEGAASHNPLDLLTPDRIMLDIQTLYEPLEEIASSLKPAQSVEVMTHPAYLDKFVMDQSSLLYERLEDFSALTDTYLQTKLEKSKLFELATYRDLP